ncbi:MAG: serine hydrolase [Puniceicoccales bacterium]
MPIATMLRPILLSAVATLAFAAPQLQAQGQNPNEVSAVTIPPQQIEDAIAALDGIVTNVMAETGVPGMAVAVVHDDKLVYAKGFGVKQVGGDDPIDENTVFQIASISKSVGATAIATIVDGENFSWNDRVVDYYPNFALADPYVTENVTIGDLYSHRSGLPPHAGDLLEDLGYNREEVIERLRYLPLTPFRDSYFYTNFGMTAGGVAAANSVNMTWEDFSEKQLYAPLGMDSTSSRYSDFMTEPNKALGNQLQPDGTWAPTIKQRKPDAQSPAGGVSSSAADMAKWMRMLLNNGTFEGKEIISETALVETLTPQYTSSPARTITGRPGFYTHGFDMQIDGAGRTRYTHSGGFLLGTATNVQLLPSEKLGIIALSNGTPVGAPETVNATFMELVQTGETKIEWLAGYGRLFAAMLDNPSVLDGKEPPANPTPAPAADTLTGQYASDYFGDLEIVATGDGVAARLGPNQTAYPLIHWDGNEFAWEATGENGLGLSQVTFVMGPDGQAKSVTFESLDENGLGTFKR